MEKKLTLDCKRSELRIVSIHTQDALVQFMRSGACASAGSVMTIVHKEELQSLSTLCEKESFVVHQSLTNNEASDRIQTMHSNVQKRKTAIAAFKSLIESEKWMQLLSDATSASEKRKSHSNAELLAECMNKVLTELSSLFEGVNLCWNVHNRDVLYSIPLSNRVFYVVSFFKDIVSVMKVMLRYQESLFDELDELLVILDKKFFNVISADIIREEESLHDDDDALSDYNNTPN